MQYTFTLKDLSATKELADHIAQTIKPGFVLSLSGDLGSGKTTLVREILFALGVRGSVKSPTYTIVEIYQVQAVYLYHFDLYRFNNASEWAESGFDEYITPQSICFIEWAEKCERSLAVADWRLNFEIINDTARDVQFKAITSKGQTCLHQLMRYGGSLSNALQE